jgi:hypothetical protein
MHISAVCGKRYYLKVDLNGGKSFLDHFSHNNDGNQGGGDENLRTRCKMKLVLHIFYKSQRFLTRPVDCCCDPHFKDSFMIDIGYFQSKSHELMRQLHSQLQREQKLYICVEKP